MKKILDGRLLKRMVPNSEKFQYEYQMPIPNTNFNSIFQFVRKGYPRIPKAKLFGEVLKFKVLNM